MHPKFLNKFLKLSSLPLSPPSLSTPSPCAPMLHLSRHPIRLASLQSPSHHLCQLITINIIRIMALANPNWERPVPTTAGISILRLPSLRALAYTNGEKLCGKDPWEKLGGKACPSHLSKYPASSHQGACGRSLNSFKVPFICSKSRIVFVQGLLFLDKSLASVQALDYVRMFHRPQQESIAKRAFPAGPLSCDTNSKFQPGASVLSSITWQRATLHSHFNSHLPRGGPPHPPQDSSFLRHSILGFILYHRLSLWSRLAKHFFLA